MFSPRLETERLILRMPQMADAPRIQLLASDREIAATTLNIPHPYPEGAAEEWVQRRIDATESRDSGFVLILKVENSLIGGMGIHPNQNDAAEVGYWLGKAYWNQGYATEALRRVIQFGFEEMRLNRIFASYFGNNPASRRVMEKAGMTHEGTMRQHILKWGEFLDLGYCAILRSEYEVKRA